MIKIQYDFRKEYSPDTYIENTLTQDVAQTTDVDKTITDKRFENISEAILAFAESGVNLTFERCLFINCETILSNSSLDFGNITFTHCTIFNCRKIADFSNTDTGSIIFEYCIIRETPFLITNRNISFTSGKPSCIQDFFGYSGTITYNDTIRKNPCFIDNTDFILMSKSRGYDYDSPCLKEIYSGIEDMGCWLEHRATGIGAYSEWLVEYVPREKKTNKKIGFSSFEDVNGIARSFQTDQKKTINLDFDYNGLTEDDAAHFFNMDKAKDNLIRYYPDSTDDTRYLECRLVKTETVAYSKENGNFWDNGLLKEFMLKGFQINATVEKQIGDNWI
jgi:hypothetical protein